MSVFNPQAFATKPQNIYIDDGIHYPIAALLPGGNKLVVGEKSKAQFQTVEGKPLENIAAEYSKQKIQPQWKVTKGVDRLKINEDGTIEALQAGDATIQGTIPGLAAHTGFLFIKALGRVGAVDAQGNINWDILSMVLFFGVSLYVNQQLSGQQGGGANAQQQQTINKITPVLFSGMFLFFPLPAGVLMYIVIANIFQTIQTVFLMREPFTGKPPKTSRRARKTRKGTGITSF